MFTHKHKRKFHCISVRVLYVGLLVKDGIPAADEEIMGWFVACTYKEVGFFMGIDSGLVLVWVQKSSLCLIR